MTDPAIEHRPWTVDEFRRAFGADAFGTSRADQLVLEICNAALEHGLDRDQVLDTVRRLTAFKPESVGDLLVGALSDRMEAEGN